MAVLDFILQVAAEHHASLVERDQGSAIFDVSPPLASGSPDRGYRLKVTSAGSGPKIREMVPTRLPAFCPDRHINVDGTFCLYWAEEEPLTFVTAEDASVWWSKVLLFLIRQRAATALRRWPGDAEARAHGPEAARHQANAERLAALLGSYFTRRHAQGQFRVTRKVRLGERRLRLTCDGVRICSVLEVGPKLMTLRSRCRCDEGDRKGLTVRACGDHAEVLARYVASLHEQEREEERFYALMRERKRICCRTIDRCPLAA